MFSQGISEKDMKKLNLQYAKTAQEAVDKALKKYDPDEKILIVKAGAETLPIL
jgi:hypothetical protein